MDCAECEGSGHVSGDCPDCGGLGERWEGVTCRPCRGGGVLTRECDADGCEEGEVEEDYEEQMRVGLEVLADYPITLTKLSEDG